jgi:hypothetical protein
LNARYDRQRPSREVAGERGFALVTFGTGGRFTRRNIDEAGMLLEADLERFTLGRHHFRT